MLKLSTKSRYGTIACFYLALKGSVMSLSEISEIAGISLRYLEQLFSKLKKADIIQSIRGAGGGYQLTKKPSEITLLEIMTCLEGNVLLVNCQGDGCKKSHTCPTNKVWSRINKNVQDMLCGISLQDLVDDYN